jgi:hypothetical protein
MALILDAVTRALHLFGFNSSRRRRAWDVRLFCGADGTTAELLSGEIPAVAAF